MLHFAALMPYDKDLRHLHVLAGVVLGAVDVAAVGGTAEIGEVVGTVTVLVFETVVIATKLVFAGTVFVTAEQVAAAVDTVIVERVVVERAALFAEGVGRVWQC